MKTPKQLKERYAEIEADFKAIPELERIFKEYEKEIYFYYRYAWSEVTTKEKLIKKRDDLLRLAKKIDQVDLLILYYLENIEGWGKYSLVKSLRKLYCAQCDLKNQLSQTGEFVDIMEIGEIVSKNTKNSKKNLKNP